MTRGALDKALMPEGESTLSTLSGVVKPGVVKAGVVKALGLKMTLTPVDEKS